MLPEGCLALFCLIVKRLFVVLVPVLELGCGHSYVCLDLWGVLVRSDRGLVHYIFASAVSIFGAGALLFLATVARGVLIFLVQDFRIVCRNNFFHVWCSSVRHFDSVFINHFSEGVSSGEMGF